jgi:hypothetical protein
MTDEDYEQLRSERDALAKRVRELESTDFMAYTNELVAEADRLRAENERLAKSVETWKGDAEHYRAERLRSDQEIDRLTPALTAAQDRVRELQTELDLYKQGQVYTGWREAQKRVRELEEAGQELRDVTREAEWPRACRAWDRAAKKATGPITDPTQGVGTVGIDWAVPGSERTMETIIDHTGAVVSCRERPSLIPADCQHYIQLPSGLWAWVENYDLQPVHLGNVRRARPNTCRLPRRPRAWGEGAGMEVMIDWQDIGTAPKDGREVLLYRRDRTQGKVWPGELIATFSPTTIGRWITYNGPHRWNTQHTMMLGCTATAAAGATWTHWAPLTPPEGK